MRLPKDKSVSTTSTGLPQCNVWLVGRNRIKTHELDFTGLKQGNITWHTAHKFESSDAAHWEMGKQSKIIALLKTPAKVRPTWHPKRESFSFCNTLLISMENKIGKAHTPVLLHCVRTMAWHWTEFYASCMYLCNCFFSD